MNRQFVVVGLGRLGISMVGTLDSLGHELLAIDRRELDKSLSELDLSQKMGLTVLTLKPQNGPGSLPHGDTVLRDGDVLVVGGSRIALDRSPLVQPDGL
jgi:Trk K+ transport system NAD-binding subunit